MDDENNANLDAVFKNCQSDCQSFLNMIVKYLRNKTNVLAGDNQHILSKAFENAIENCYGNEQQQPKQQRSTKLTVETINGDSSTPDLLDETSRDLFDDLEEVIPETQDLLADTDDSGESICIPFYDKPKDSDSSTIQTNVCGDDDSEFIQIRPESNVPEPEDDELQSQFLMANIDQSLINDLQTSTTNINQIREALSSTSNVETIDAHHEMNDSESQHATEKHCVDRSGSTTPDLDFFTADDKGKENQPKEIFQNGVGTEMPSDSFFDACTQPVNRTDDATKETSTDDIFEAATQLPVFKQPAAVFSTPKVPNKQKPATINDSIFDVPTQRMSDDEDIFNVATQIIATDKPHTITEDVSLAVNAKPVLLNNYDKSDEIFEMETQVFEPRQSTHSTSPVQQDLNETDIFEQATQIMEPSTIIGKAKNKRLPLIQTQCSQPANTPEWSMAARLTNAQIEQFEKERAESETTKMKEKLKKHRYLFASSSDEDDEDDFDDLEFDLPKPTERIVVPIREIKQESFSPESNSNNNSKRVSTKPLDPTVNAKKSKSNEIPAKTRIRQISVKVSRKEVSKIIEDETKMHTKKTSHIKNEMQNRNTDENSTASKLCGESRVLRNKKSDKIDSNNDIEMVRENKRKKQTDIDELALPKQKNRKHKSEGSTKIQRTNKIEDGQLKDSHKKKTISMENTTSEEPTVIQSLPTDSLVTSTIRRQSERFSTRKSTQIGILFTQVKPAPYTETIQRLGGCVVDKPRFGSVLICNEISRTFKFLYALAKGIPIVSSQWLDKSATAGVFVPTEPFLTNDKKAERRFKFCLKKSLESSQQTPLFTNFHIFATQNVQPTRDEIAEIVECSGGKFANSIVTKRKSNTIAILVSHENESKMWQKYRDHHSDIKIVSSEWFMRCVLQQKIDFSRYILD